MENVVILTIAVCRPLRPPCHLRCPNGLVVDSNGCDKCMCAGMCTLVYRCVYSSFDFIVLGSCARYQSTDN